MYKMLVIDVDDTLLNDELKVPEETKQALVTAAEQGIIITLATGRMFASAKQTALQLGLNVPIITYQGALVKNVIDEKVHYECTVPRDVAGGVMEWAEQNGLHLQLYVNDKLYTREDNDKIKMYSKMSNVPYRVEPDYAKLLEMPTMKMLVIDEPERLDALKPDLEKLLGAEAHITKSKPNFLEVMHPQGTKGTALRHLAAEYGCTVEQVIAIGDSWNDHDMIETAGLGVAMGNAIPALKEIADYVTLTNNEQGVKHVIEKFIFQYSQSGK